MKELIIFPCPLSSSCSYPFIQITELFHLISAACASRTEQARSGKCTSTSKHKIQLWPSRPHHPKTNKHSKQRGIHHRRCRFDKSLCFSITIISPELDKGSTRSWKMETQWIWPATKEKKPFPVRREMIVRHRSCKESGDYILILNSHSSGFCSNGSLVKSSNME